MTDPHPADRPEDADDVAAPRSVGSATNEEATGTADAFVLTVRPEGVGPPGPVRVRRFLKTALRSHALRCVSAAGLPASPTGHLAQTNAPGHWRPRGRGIRRAAGETTHRTATRTPR